MFLILLPVRTEPSNRPTSSPIFSRKAMARSLTDNEIAELRKQKEEAESGGGVYNNLFMKNYVTAILKKQWGENISKFEGMTLPGGVTLNGRQLIDDAKEEIEKEIEKLRNEYDNPPNFFVG